MPGGCVNHDTALWPFCICTWLEMRECQSRLCSRLAEGGCLCGLEPTAAWQEEYPFVCLSRQPPGRGSRAGCQEVASGLCLPFQEALRVARSTSSHLSHALSSHRKRHIIRLSLPHASLLQSSHNIIGNKKDHKRDVVRLWSYACWYAVGQR